jgi:hypothetical protein
MSGERERYQRIGRVVAAVIRQAVVDARAEGVVLLAGPEPESRLAREWCSQALEASRVVVATSRPRHLTVSAASKTTLLLSEVSPAALFPLGDLYGSELLELSGAWEPPASIRELVEAAGGPTTLDGALRRWAEERRNQEDVWRGLPPDGAARVRAALLGNRFARWRGGLVPKLTARTLGIDLWE